MGSTPRPGDSTSMAASALVEADTEKGDHLVLQNARLFCI